VAQHPEEARDVGRAASRWAVAERDVWRKGPAVLDFVQAHRHRVHPAHRRRVMWAPVRGRRCGVAQYTRELVGALGAAGCATTPTDEPDLAGSALLHVQHEWSLIGTETVAGVVARAARHRVPVVVTEHSVRADGVAWEGEVAALVAHSAEAAALLRNRWPDRRVEHLPHGCPTWFPPRKRRRARTVATFGFLEPHKGVTALLDAADRLGDVEVVVFGSAKEPGADAWWTDRPRRVPVRRESAFLDSEDVARRLAGEADVLVYWYDRAPFLAASGAARIGLASGVPVLTSRTSWFADLAGATLQPDDLVTGLARLLDDTGLRAELVDAAREYCEQHSWPRTARRHRALYASLSRG
jgi:glycosyltransferase involved in cell wall biosynthesis